MHNEHRKLVLWLDLFGNSQGVDVNGEQPVEGNGTNSGENNSMLAIESNGQEGQESTKQQQTSGPIPYTIDDVNALFDVMSEDKEPTGKSQDAAKVLMDRIKDDMERLSGLNVDQLDDNPEIMLKVGAALRAQLPTQSIGSRGTGNGAVQVTANGRSILQPQKLAHWSGLPDITSYGNFLSDQDITEDDLVMPRTSESAAETLQEAKDELMARLQDTSRAPEESNDQSYDEGQVQDTEIEDEIPDSAEESEEEDDDEEDYHNPNDQERGLLTDVPLVLGPTEIEALPMIIQAGIVDNFGSIKSSSDRQGAKNMQAVRCHILLAQEAGRNVLRELLIFIAAWDLPDDEFYFKMMVQIMESILKNGLMSHAYSDFGQAKDIISPAQAVVIKILTHIFRSKYSPSSGQNNNEQPPPRPKIPAPLSRVDVLTVRYIFTVFRGNIIPETCALIYLQGQIRAGLAMAEDFPLNLWDMERVYEGVYQFLEFFAVLTENNDWKSLLVEWEIVYDLVTLLKELDASIPKAPLSASMAQPAANQTGTLTASKTLQPSAQSASSVERLHNSSTSSQQPPLPPLPSTPASQALSDSSTPLPPAPRNQSPPPPTPSEDPSTFEWRNLKKLIVLVLSSLVWKSVNVQTQIRENVGVETILSCTQYDGHNPYIKEHAVMCLKFLLESNAENQAIVRELEARGVVNDSNTDDLGVRARLGGDGRVRVENINEPPSNLANVMMPGAGGTSSGTGSRSGGPSIGAGERARRMARRASESNAAAELLGERFAKLDLERKNAGASGSGGHVERERFEAADDDDDFEFM